MSLRWPEVNCCAQLMCVADNLQDFTALEALMHKSSHVEPTGTPQLMQSRRAIVSVQWVSRQQLGTHVMQGGVGQRTTAQDMLPCMHMAGRAVM